MLAAHGRVQVVVSWSRLSTISLPEPIRTAESAVGTLLERRYAVVSHSSQIGRHETGPLSPAERVAFTFLACLALQIVPTCSWMVNQEGHRLRPADSEASALWIPRLVGSWPWVIDGIVVLGSLGLRDDDMDAVFGLDGVVDVLTRKRTTSVGPGFRSSLNKTRLCLPKLYFSALRRVTRVCSGLAKYLINAKPVSSPF